MENNFKTTDLPLASYLLYSKARFIGIENYTQSKKMFVFDSDKDINKLIKAYHTRSAKVNPIEYYESIREIKRILYSS